jgi:hypothetical protein
MSRNLDHQWLDRRYRAPSAFRRWLGFVFGWLLLSSVAALVAWAGFSLPTPGRGGKSTCQVSGAVTSQGRPVTRGTINFSCLMLSGEEIESKLFVRFPHLTVSIKDGHYSLSNRDGLIPGRYQITIQAEEFAADEEPTSSVSQRTDATIRYSETACLVEVCRGRPQVIDFEL